MASAVRLARVRELQDDTPENVCERITARIQDRIQREGDVWLRDDYQIAWLTVRWAFKGVPVDICYSAHPSAAATYQIVHCHPDDVWPHIMANRKARLGEEFSDFYDAAGNLKPDVPKKPSIVFAEDAEQATNVLMFPALQSLVMEKKSGKLLEMRSATQIEARQSLRILPA